MNSFRVEVFAKAVQTLHIESDFPIEEAVKLAEFLTSFDEGTATRRDRSDLMGLLLVLLFPRAKTSQLHAGIDVFVKEGLDEHTIDNIAKAIGFDPHPLWTSVVAGTFVPQVQEMS